MPSAFNSAINNMVSKLPPQDQSWALLMANTLLQPSVSLVSLSAVPRGLLATIQLSLYNGDPQPTTASKPFTREEVRVIVQATKNG